jgi:hypothetical protein
MLIFTSVYQMLSPSLSPSFSSPDAVINTLVCQALEDVTDSNISGAQNMQLTEEVLRPYTPLSPPVHNFKFIVNGDRESTRKAKSHAIKDFKRKQKAQSSRFLERKYGAKTHIAAAPPRSHRQGSVKEEDLDSHCISAPLKISTYLDGEIDPFNLFPVRLISDADKGLVQHCESSRFLHS